MISLEFSAGPFHYKLPINCYTSFSLANWSTSRNWLQLLPQHNGQSCLNNQVQYILLLLLLSVSRYLTCHFVVQSVPAFPSPAKSINPFDINDDRSQVRDVETACDFSFKIDLPKIPFVLFALLQNMCFRISEVSFKAQGQKEML